MKRFYLSAHTAAAMLIAASVSVWASLARAEETASNSGTASSETSASKPGSYEELLSRFDKNGDGKIDENEKAAAHEDIRQGVTERRRNALQFFNRFDKNKDGKLDESEKAAMKGFLQQREGRVRGQVREALMNRLSEPGELKPTELYDHLAVAGTRAKVAPKVPPAPTQKRMTTATNSSPASK